MYDVAVFGYSVLKILCRRDWNVGHWDSTDWWSRVYPPIKEVNRNVKIPDRND